jgi:hypothetical protein
MRRHGYPEMPLFFFRRSTDAQLSESEELASPEAAIAEASLVARDIAKN